MNSKLKWFRKGIPLQSKIDTCRLVVLKITALEQGTALLDHLDTYRQHLSRTRVVKNKRLRSSRLVLPEGEERSSQLVIQFHDGFLAAEGMVRTVAKERNR